MPVFVAGQVSACDTIINMTVEKESRTVFDRRDTWLWAGMVFVAFLSLLWMLRHCCGAAVGAELGWFGLMTLAEAVLLTLPLLWLPRRWRWTLWMALVVLSLFDLVNVVYWRRFGALMPYTTMFWWGNIDSMVVDASVDSLALGDLWFAGPVLAVLTAWLLYFRKRVDYAAFRCRTRLWLTVGAFVAWAAGEALSTGKYYVDHIAADSADVTLSDAVGNKFYGERLNRTTYLEYNGLLVYAFWNLRDFSPALHLSKADRARIDRFIQTQNRLNASSPAPEASPSASERRPNFLLIMVESLESWPLTYKVGGQPVMPVLDSLINNAPGTLYWPDIASQISVGTSSDGHMMDITGILPLRDYSAAQDFAGDTYPSIFHAFGDLGYHTFEITCDDPAMWNQGNTRHVWGFADYRHDTDVDPKRESSWSQRDTYWADYVGKYVAAAQRPWAGMAVTLSLHSPYRSELKSYPELDGHGLDPQSVHYLKMCRLDDTCIATVLDSLRSVGIYDNTIVAITGDHMAQGLFDSHRPADMAGRPKRIPLLVLNAPLESAIRRGTAGQIDIYPTLLDICGLKDYHWRGVGLSLLRYPPRGAVNRLGGFEGVGVDAGDLSAGELRRQREAWEVSRLILAGNYFGQ